MDRDQVIKWFKDCATYLQGQGLDTSNYFRFAGQPHVQGKRTLKQDRYSAKKMSQKYIRYAKQSMDRKLIGGEIQAYRLAARQQTDYFRLMKIQYSRDKSRGVF